MTTPTLIDLQGNEVEKHQWTGSLVSRNQEDIAWEVSPGTYYYENLPITVGSENAEEDKVELSSGVISVEHTTSYIITSQNEPPRAPIVIPSYRAIAEEEEAKKQQRAAVRAKRDEGWLANAVLVGA